MKLLHWSDNISALHNAVVTVGSFDGVHFGHRAILRRVTDMARSVNGVSVVVTFDPHPRHLLDAKSNMKLLSTLPEKSFLLEQIGIDYLVVIPFDRAMAQVDWFDFVAKYLVEKIGARHLIVGYNHHFGHNKEGNFDLLNKMHDVLGISVDIQPKEDVDNHKVSSTILRKIISSGDVALSGHYLTMPYIVIGEICEHKIIVDSNKLLPENGRYNVQVVIQGVATSQQITIQEQTIFLDDIDNEGPAMIMFT